MPCRAMWMAGQAGEGSGHCTACHGEGLLQAEVNWRWLGSRQRAGSRAEHHRASWPVLTWQQSSSSSRRLRRRGWDIPPLGCEPHGEHGRVPGFLPALGSSSALAARALAHGRPCTRHQVMVMHVAGPVPGQSWVMHGCSRRAREGRLRRCRASPGHGTMLLSPSSPDPAWL